MNNVDAPESASVFMNNVDAPESINTKDAPESIPVFMNEKKNVQFSNVIKVINKQNSKTPTPEFIQEIYNLFTIEKKLLRAVIPRMLPKDVLPPVHKRGLFTHWINQVPGIKKEILKMKDENNFNREQYMYWLDKEYQIDNILNPESRDETLR
jgi:hypothetical protein